MSENAVRTWSVLVK